MRDLSDITAYILADGFETSPAPVVAARSVILAEVLGRPCVYYFLDRLADCGLLRVVFCTERTERLEDHLGGTYRGMTLSYSRADESLGSGGALRLALELHPASRALVLDGEILVEADWSAFADWFAMRPEAGALLLAHADTAARHGRVIVDETGRVTALAGQGGGGPGLVGVGACLLRPEDLAGFWPESPISLERDVLPRLAALGRLCALETRARFLDMTAPEALAAAGRFLLRRENAPDGVAVFLDRDGTLIEERHYLHDPAGVALLPGVAEGLRRLRELGCLLVLVSNQSGVGRGYFGRTDVERVHGRLIELLASRGASLDAFYVCPHAPGEQCDCRKPLPGLVERACREIGLDAGRGFVIGDKPCDVELARAAGADGILVLTGYGARHEAEARAGGTLVARDLAEAAEIVARLRAQS